MTKSTTYTPEAAAEICTRLSGGEPLASICRSEGMPAVRTVSDWKAAHPSFAADFARARDEGYDAIATDCLDIADDSTRDTIVGEHGAKADAEWIARSKLRVETRLKLLAKWDPKRYGDSTKVEMAGNLTLNHVSDSELDDELAQLELLEKTRTAALTATTKPTPPDDFADLA